LHIKDKNMKDICYTVHLHGNLGNLYGKAPIKLYGKSLQDIMQGLFANYGDKFKNLIRKNAWHITRGKRKTTEDMPVSEDTFMTSDEIHFALFTEEVHIFPAIQGAGGKGGMSMILGALLIVVAVFMWWNPVGWAAAAGAVGITTTAAAVSATAWSIAISGAMMLAGGVMSMMASSPKVGDYTKAEVDRSPSFIFNGAVNTVEQGGAIPLVYGRHLTGSIVISAGLYTDQILDQV
jgi:predicted phage tail protein